MNKANESNHDGGGGGGGIDMDLQMKMKMMQERLIRFVNGSKYNYSNTKNVSFHFKGERKRENRDNQDTMELMDVTATNIFDNT